MHMQRHFHKTLHSILVFPSAFTL